MKDIAIKPVRVDIGGGKSRILQTVGDLGEFLLYQWPVKGGEKHRLARIACIDVLDKQQTPDEARTAFIDACRDAGVFVFADDGGRPERRTKR